MEKFKLAYPTLVAASPVPAELLKDLKALGFSIVTEVPATQSYLKWESETLSLHTASGLSVVIDFADNKYRRDFKPSKELLCRACGWHLGYRSVWDLTAGFAVDAMMLAQAGFQVRASEHNPLLGIQLRQALRESLGRENSPPFLSKLQFEIMDAATMLENVSNPPEVIYYDPMYPAKRKTALPSKEMQILREINGTSGESLELLEKALRVGVKRVVVKRPLKAPPLMAKPQAEISGKLVRYDIYWAGL